MAMLGPQLDETSKRILQAIQRIGVAPGWQVIREVSVTPEQLVEAARALIASGLVNASGSVSNADEIYNAYFSIQPSSADLVEYVLRP